MSFGSGGHIQSSRLIYFQYVFDFLANNFNRANKDTFSYTISGIIPPWSQLTSVTGGVITDVGKQPTCKVIFATLAATSHPFLYCTVLLNDFVCYLYY